MELLYCDWTHHFVVLFTKCVRNPHCEIWTCVSHILRCHSRPNRALDVQKVASPQKTSDQWFLHLLLCLKIWVEMYPYFEREECVVFLHINAYRDKNTMNAYMSYVFIFTFSNDIYSSIEKHEHDALLGCRQAARSIFVLS